jgi:hypothetical protein
MNIASHFVLFYNFDMTVKKGTKMDFTKPKDGVFSIATQYLFDYILKYSLYSRHKINPAYNPTLVPELEYDNYARTDKTSPARDDRTNNVRDFMEYMTGGFNISTDEHGAPDYLEDMWRKLQSERHSFVMFFLPLQFDSEKKERYGRITYEVMMIKNMLRSKEAIDADRLTDLARDTAAKYFPRFISFSETDNIRDFRQWWTSKKEIVEAWARKCNAEPVLSKKQELIKNFNSGLGDYDAAVRILHRNAKRAASARQN